MNALRLIARAADAISDLFGPAAPVATGGEPGSTWLAGLLEEQELAA